MFCCFRCGERFFTKKELFDHMKEDHLKEMFSPHIKPTFL